MKKFSVCLVIGLLAAGAGEVAEEPLPLLPSGWHVHDRERPLPPVITPGATNAEPPSDAIVLFDGTNTDEWWANAENDVQWKIQDGYMEIVPKTHGMSTRRKFGDMQLHLEWAAPEEIKGHAQQRGNSGVFLMGKYEVQIMDAWENDSYADGMVAAVYGQTPALVNAAKKPGEWQTYDIIFKAPVFEDDKLVSPAYVTVFHNGVLVQNHTEILGPTRHKKAHPYEPHEAKRPFFLQNHGQVVRYRNIWVREL
ncbi:3-keto-disaccharide hydrolase [Algisphaera agarilytica]|uniref:3-keto-alpha-glucoside-1,2-lyase/3-keto-2-hydroxy-glucal hydratase domain-containing protein n=1 Tax=Algisphaera agarilytica TaxID=1385975 RepID=A0A7X0LM85_9BACT|nr:DUF1080 domain-containing protein [Algisphaera agarilytica]MBB6431699.1 hypothetical protein [Algisphaera agarilytica]